MLVWHGTELKLLAGPPSLVSVRVYIYKHRHSLSLSQRNWMGTSTLDLWAIAFCLSPPLPLIPSHAILGSATPILSSGVQTMKTLLKVWICFIGWLFPFIGGLQPVPGPLGIIVRRAEICLHICIFSIDRC